MLHRGDGRVCGGLPDTLPTVQANGGAVPALAPPGGNATAGAKNTPGGDHSTSSATPPKKKAAGQAALKKAARHAAQYKDGTYTGTGSNPYGTLAVSLTVANGRISTVKITQYNMHYPQSIIDPQLPGEVVSMQTWHIYIITGATASTYNFAEAVYNALQKAKA